MKRTAATLALLAGFGGGCVSPDRGGKTIGGGFGTVTTGRTIAGYQGPTGEPVMAARAATPGVVPAGGSGSAGIEPALFRKYGTPAAGECTNVAHVPGLTGCRPVSHLSSGCGPGGCSPVPAYLPPGHMHQPAGILPVPGMGPPGAVAGVGAFVGGQPAVPNGRTSVKFTGPAGMKITWQLPDGSFNDEASGLTAPKEYNFVQGQVYRLRLTQILPNHPGKSFYPTLEVAPANPKSLTFLAHSSVPLTFTNDDFDYAAAGNLVVKVVYLPDRDNQDFVTIAGAEEVNSIRLEPGVDPVAEAQRKGTVLVVVRLGNIDLENRSSPAMTAPPGSGLPPASGPVQIPGPSPKPGNGMGSLPPGSSRVSFLPPVSPAAPSPTLPPAVPPAPSLPTLGGPAKPEK